MEIRFESFVKKGNNRGAGFVSIPIEQRNGFSINDEIKVMLNSKKGFYSKIKFYGTLGFYIPVKIMSGYLSQGSKINAEIEIIEGFYTKIGSDGRFYIPKDIAQKYQLNSGDILEMEYTIEGQKGFKFCFVNARDKSNTQEYMCMLNIKRANKEGVFKIARKLTRCHENSNLLVNHLLKELFCAPIDNNHILVYSGKNTPVIINPNIGIKDIAYYLGCYFSDGTKRGNNWGICASTFKQGRFYIESHNNLIKDSKLVFSISFTDINNQNKDWLTKELVNKWQGEINDFIDKKRVRIINSDKEYSPKTNPFGTLILKENRKLTQIYYNLLLDLLFKKINEEKNKEVILNFICGVLEGDGSVSARKRGHLIITSNRRELKILGSIINISGLKYKVYMEGENKGYVRIGSLEIIKNILFLKDRLFVYYPKRRKILKERLANTGCARFLLGKTDKTSNWLIGQLNLAGILDGRGNLTKKGLEIKENLKEFLEK